MGFVFETRAAFRFRLAVACILAGMVVSAFLAWLGTRHATTDAAWVVHTLEAERQSSETRVDLYAWETEIVRCSQAKRCAETNALAEARVRVSRDLSALGAFTQDNPTQQARMRTIEAKWNAVSAYAQWHPDVDVTLHALRAELVAFEQQEERLLDSRTRTAHGSQRRNGEITLAVALLGALGTLLTLLSMQRDLRRVFAQARDVEENALHDELTGLRNRRGFLTAAEQLMRQARRHGTRTALLFIDLDELKAINDEHGHAAGDEALQRVAHAMASTFRESDVIARLGGDEFVAMIDDASTESVERVIARLRGALEREGCGLFAPAGLSCSVGYVLKSPDDEATVDAMLSNADAKMYEDKRTRRAGRTSHV